MAAIIQSPGCEPKVGDAATMYRMALGLALWRQCEQGDGCDLQLEHDGGILTFHRCILNAAFPQLAIKPEPSEQLLLCKLMALPFSMLRGILYLLYTGCVDPSCLETLSELHSACTQLGLSNLVNILEEILGQESPSDSGLTAACSHLVTETDGPVESILHHSGVSQEPLAEEHSVNNKSSLLQTKLVSHPDSVEGYTHDLQIKELDVSCPEAQTLQKCGDVTSNDSSLQSVTSDMHVDSRHETNQELSLQCSSKLASQIESQNIALEAPDADEGDCFDNSISEDAFQSANQDIVPEEHSNPVLLSISENTSVANNINLDTKVFNDDTPLNKGTDCEESDVHCQTQEIVATIEAAEPNVIITKSGQQVISCDVPQGAVGVSLSPSMKEGGGHGVLVITRNKDGSLKRTFVVVKKRDNETERKNNTTDSGREHSSLMAGCSIKKGILGRKRQKNALTLEKLVCSSCGDQHSTLKHLYMHRSQEHSWSLHNQQDFPVLQCQESACNFETLHQGQMTNHLKKKHNKHGTRSSPHVCEFCGLIANTPSALAAHRNSHTGNRPFACHICDKKFRTNPSLWSHLIGVHKRKDEKETWQYQCKDCDYRGMSAYPLRVHRMKKHGATYPGCHLWKCDQCSHLASTPAALKIHRTKHSDERAFQCSKCGMSFRTKGTLKGHQVVHESKNVHCPHCIYVTSTKKLLLRHVKCLHSSTKETQPYQCIHCNYTGRLRSHITKHIKMVHNKVNNGPELPGQRRRKEHHSSLDIKQTPKQLLKPSRGTSISEAMDARHIVLLQNEQLQVQNVADDEQLLVPESQDIRVLSAAEFGQLQLADSEDVHSVEQHEKLVDSETHVIHGLEAVQAQELHVPNAVQGDLQNMSVISAEQLELSQGQDQCTAQAKLLEMADTHGMYILNSEQHEEEVRETEVQLVLDTSQLPRLSSSQVVVVEVPAGLDLAEAASTTYMMETEGGN